MSENVVYLVLLGLVSVTTPPPKSPAPVVESVSATNKASSAPCRPFKTLTELNGRVEMVHGTACRQADGTWKAF